MGAAKSKYFVRDFCGVRILGVEIFLRSSVLCARFFSVGGWVFFLIRIVVPEVCCLDWDSFCVVYFRGETLCFGIKLPGR